VNRPLALQAERSASIKQQGYIAQAGPELSSHSPFGSS
jgi:hypothetical protein